MRWTEFFTFMFVVIFLAAVYFYLYQYQVECESKGGVAIRGIFGVQCVKGEPIK